MKTKTNKAHTLEGFFCWCNPGIQQLCTQCEEGDAECWQCDGARWFNVEVPSPGAEEAYQHIVTHRCDICQGVDGCTCKGVPDEDE